MTSLTTVLPLYSWPTLPAWASLTSSIEANPSLKFTVIVNPSSGPGDSQYPTSDYIAGMAQLNGYSNTELYGYVHTGWAKNSVADVETNVTKYAGWKDYVGADIHVDGIFFDEAPAVYTEADYTYMSTLSAFASSSQLTKIIFNPGTIPDNHYYAIADTIIAFEDSYTAYSSSVLNALPDEFLGQSAVLILDFTGSSQDQDTIINDLKVKGVDGLYVSTEGDYNEASTMWGQFCEGMLLASESETTSAPVTTSVPEATPTPDTEPAPETEPEPEDVCEL